MRRSTIYRLAPWVPPKRGDTKKTVPPLPPVEYGGPGGVSKQYSARISSTPYWKRMAVSTYETRMQENATNYPMSHTNPGEFDTRYLPAPYPDLFTKPQMLHVGQADRSREVEVPVIFLEDVIDPDTNVYIGRKHETAYVAQHFVREELFPQRFCIYATPENYRLLGLPVQDHHIHAEIGRNEDEYAKINAKRLWDEEPWKFSFEYLFRRYANGAPELEHPTEPWDGVEPEVVGASGGAQGSAGPGFVQKRKAKKIKLF